MGYFVAVADAGSVSAAARVTHITQPSLSRQLRQLEKELGLELFTRQDGPLTLTPAGRQFLPAARDLLGRAEATRAAAAQILRLTKVVGRLGDSWLKRIALEQCMPWLRRTPADRWAKALAAP